MKHVLLFAVLMWAACSGNPEHAQESSPVVLSKEVHETSLVILGTTQDAGSPHIGCERLCCQHATEKRMVVSLGLIDPEQQRSYLFEATPDMTGQLDLLAEYAPFENRKTSDGVFLTHAHIGHYTGLMYFGREALGADSVPVHAMPQMRTFLETNGPWSQLVSVGNIRLQHLQAEDPVRLSEKISVVPFRVPHRDEYSETVGYKIIGPQKAALFIPDIDKWDKWETRIEDLIAEVDFALLDGTFFHGDEIGHRDIAEIPHPFVIESLDRFAALPPEERNKIHFIHFNHTNPLLNPESEQYRLVIAEGFHIAAVEQIFAL